MHHTSQIPLQSEVKLRELILHVAIQSEGDPTFGATKLNKLLFFADFGAYQHFGKPITGVEYQKLENGPAPRGLVTIRDEMIAEGEIALRKISFHGYEQHKVLALREPDLSVFTTVELDAINRVIELGKNKSASELSDRSHQFLGWQLADMYETIPYEVALVGTRKPTPEEVEYALSFEEEARELLAN